jgi:GntR family transcriptional regulator/MocR family aminotransferase
VVTGVAQALALLARVLRARGLGEIAVEDPGSRGARDDLAYWGLRPVPVPVDEHGLRSASWPAAARGRRCSRPRTSSPPGSCWPRSAAATCWTGPPRRTA